MKKQEHIFQPATTADEEQLSIIASAHKGLFKIAGMILLLTVTAWLFLGRIAFYVHGNGMLLNKEGIKTVFAENAGRVVKVNAQIGSTIQKGENIAQIERASLLKEIENAQERLQQEINVINSNFITLDQRKLYSSQSIKDLQVKLEKQKSLLADKIIAEDRYIDTMNTIFQLQTELIKVDREKIKSKNKIEDLRRDKEILEKNYQDQIMIRSPYAGKVVEMMFNEGSVLENGSPLMTIELTSKKELQAILYFPVADAKKIQKGMALDILPGFTKAQEYGAIQAIVDYVDHYPASEQAMFNEVQNKTFIDMILNQGVQQQVNAILLKDSTTHSGYAWTTKQGAPIELQSGTFCQARIKIEEKRPIDVIVSQLRSWMGLE